MPSLRRDNRLIDALEAMSGQPFQGNVWRAVRDGRDPTQSSRSGGRWDDGSFDVLYTSLSPEGAAEEIRYHLRKGQPVIPSKVKYSVHRIALRLSRVLHLHPVSLLQSLGYDASRFGQLQYDRRLDEYPQLREIAEVAQFLDYEAIIVPSARSDALNLVLFLEKISHDALGEITNEGPVQV